MVLQSRALKWGSSLLLGCRGKVGLGWWFYVGYGMMVESACVVIGLRFWVGFPWDDGHAMIYVTISSIMAMLFEVRFLWLQLDCVLL